MVRKCALVAVFCLPLTGCATESGPSAAADCPAVPDIEELAPRDARNAILAAAPDGSAAVAVWESVFGEPLGAARFRDGTWSSAAPISERGAASASAAAGPGGVIAVWDGWDGDRRAVRIATRGRAGGWSPPGNASVPGGVRPRRPAVAATPSGGALIAWRGDPAGAVMAATMAPGGAIGPARALLDAGEVRDVVPVVDAGGRRTVLWSERTAAGWVVRAATSGAGGWSPAVALSAPVPLVSDLRVATGAGGHLAVVWRSELGDRRERVALRLRGPDGRWAPEPAAGPVHRRAAGLPRPPGPPIAAPAVTVDRDGRAVLAWPQQDGLHDRVMVAVADPGRDPGPPVTLTASGASGAPALATAPDGTAAVVWEDLDGPRLTARIAFLPPGTARWTGCRTLGEPGDEVAAPRVAWIDGDAVAVWGSSNDGAVLAARVPR